ncbi:helix-turn-helix domain-containing protein [Hydrogenophaga taeniospiralis]|uniref:helix-turn-helix domain-containing protein n=1 Tax=Hydrogenophaga taeniospiralis TaxID=65656 RepID=UPI001CFA3819|nr:helix-turn-helix domain-containing protein [Hydrogenophaga taeniospiralis]MCB4365741.1 helix-turn-helix domain-containing protein [Hydrogenophaga taeniospiralis]
MTGLPLAEAAQALDVSPATLRRWIRRGCPVLCRGSRGRGHQMLIDPAQVAAWRQAGDADAMVMELSAQVPETLATAMLQALQQARDVNKIRLASILCGAWYLGASGVLDLLRERNPDIGVEPLEPESIRRLRKIAGI